MIAVALVAVERTMPPAVCDGEFKLSMAIVSDSGARVNSVGYFISGYNTGLAESVVHSLGAENFETATFNGRAWDAAIWCSWRERWSGNRFGYSEPKLLVLNTDYDDGHATRQIVEIPPAGAHDEQWLRCIAFTSRVAYFVASINCLTPAAIRSSTSSANARRAGRIRTTSPPRSLLRPKRGARECKPADHAHTP